MMNVGVFFGGKSGEHEVSLMSGATVMANLDKKKYRVFALGIRKDGSMASPDETRSMLRHELPDVEAVIVEIHASEKGRMLDIVGRQGDGEMVTFDLFFPVLHGTYGEDGTIQGLLDLAEKPYVGCGVMSSSTAMDKAVMKLIFQAKGLPILPWLSFCRDEWIAESPVWMGKILKEIGMPCFIKPARLGSSVGISKVVQKEDVADALDYAFQYDYKIVVEQGIPAREIECSVMGNHKVEASPPGEIVPRREFYDYVAKYVSDDSTLLLPAGLDHEQQKEVRSLTIRAFEALGGEGYGRADFLMDKRDGRFYINEINTIPGFTTISMFPKLWGLTGMEIPRLLDCLIDLALERHRWKSTLKTSYEE